MGLLMTSFHGLIEVLVMGEQVAAGVDRDFIGTVTQGIYGAAVPPSLS